MFRIALVSFALLVTPLMLTTAAEAKTKKQAVAQCDATPGCTYYGDSSGDVIINGPKGGQVYCPNKGQCMAL